MTIHYSFYFLERWGFMINEISYTKEEHRKAFWRLFFQLKNQGKLIRVPITEEMYEVAQQFVQEIVIEKSKERQHQLDPRNEEKRWMTGVLGEMVLEELLQMTFCDRTIGQSKEYAKPDLHLLQLKIGVKSFDLGNFPLIPKGKQFNKKRVPSDGEVFIGVSAYHREAYVFGVGFNDVIEQNELNPESIRYVKDNNAKNRKTAFIALDQLHYFQTFEDLYSLAEEYGYLYHPDIKEAS